MNIVNIQINNFRLLHNVAINLEEITTAIVGKNNSGKTSFSELFNIFITEKKFEFEDFSFLSHNLFKKTYGTFLEITGDNIENKTKEIIQSIPKITLILTIKYTKQDNWTNIKPFIHSLDDSDNIKILFEYSPKDTIKLFENINENDNLLSQLKDSFRNNYRTIIRPYSDIEKTNILKLSNVHQLLHCHFIEAQRDLEDDKSNNTKLSSIFQKQYDYKKNKDNDDSDELIEATDTANKNIEEKLKSFFKQFIDSFKEFGFPGIDDATLELQSNIEIENLFRNNVQLVYNHDNKILPEKYNGLGYKNLMYIISKILSFQILHQDKKCDLNLLFIEEPEAHMHPQMQTVFIKNITSFLEKENFNVQIIISTHSSHILTNANFESIRYFTKNKNNSVIKDLSKFHIEHKDSDTLKFLEQYLTLDKGELFFSDKAILFEGVVERLLMPIFIKKLDKSESTNLSEQYISYIEIGGAYMDKFKELLKFLEIRTLIITDIDSINPEDSRKKVEISNNKVFETSNPCLKNWLPKKTNILELLSADENSKIDNKIRIAYQTKLADKKIKCGRSFEEAFLLDNVKFIFDNKNNLTSFTTILSKQSSDMEIKNNSFAITKSINKTDFAFDLLSKQGSWNIPNYIKEGLKWLSQE